MNLQATGSGGGGGSIDMASLSAAGFVRIAAPGAMRRLPAPLSNPPYPYLQRGGAESDEGREKAAYVGGAGSRGR